MSNQTAYAIETDLKLLANYRKREFEAIARINNEWDRRNKEIVAKQKYAVIEEALIGLNTLGVRPTVSIHKIIEEY